MDSALSKLNDNFLSCNICTEIFKDPCTIGCQHTFCKVCLTRYTKTRREAISAKSIQCPNCRQMTKVPRPQEPVDQWSQQFKPSFLIQGLLDTFTSQGSSDPLKICCFTCHKIGKTTQAKSVCEDCDILLCESCATMHQATPVSSGHVISPLGAGSTPQLKKRKVTCKEHNCLVEYCCKDCKKAVCQKCCIVYHRKCHSVDTLESMIPEMKQVLQQNSDQIKSYIQQAGNTLQSRRSQVEEIPQHKSSLQSEIRRVSQQAVDLIRRKEKKLLYELETLTEKQTGQLRSQIKSGEIVLQTYQQYNGFIKQVLQSNSTMDMYELYTLYQSEEITAEIQRHDIREDKAKKVLFEKHLDMDQLDQFLQLGDLKYVTDKAYFQEIPQLLSTVSTETTLPKVRYTVSTEKALPKQPSTVTTETTVPKVLSPVTSETTVTKHLSQVTSETTVPKVLSPVTSETTVPKFLSQVTSETTVPKVLSPVATETTVPKVLFPVTSEPTVPTVLFPVTSETTVPKVLSPVTSETMVPKVFSPVATETTVSNVLSPVTSDTTAPRYLSPYITETTVPKPLATVNTVSIGDINSQFATDIEVLNISGIDTLVIADNYNQSVKSCYSKRGKPHCTSLKLPKYPNRLTKIGQDRVAVSHDSENSFELIKLTPDPVLVSSIKTKKKYTCLTALSDTTLAAGCDDPPSIDVLDLSGNVLRSVITPSTGQQLIHGPSYMCTTRQGHIVVTYNESDSVYCVTQQGEVVYTYKLRGNGVTTTDTGSVIVADCSKNRIVQLTERGEYVRDLLTRQDGIDGPYGVCVHENKLYVTEEGSGINVFEF